MASGEETALAALIRTLNSAILAATSALIPKLPQEHASELHQASQRLQIWSNNLGIISGEIRERLRDQQELEFSIVTLHIMIAQGLVSAEQSTWKGKDNVSAEEVAKLRSQLPVQLAIEALEKQHPQFSDNFSATSTSTRAQSIGFSDQSLDVAHHDSTDELSGALAEVLATIDRLLRLAPFLEQYIEDSAEEVQEAERYGAVPTADINSEEADVYIHRILTRYPQASHEHVRIIVEGRRTVRMPGNLWKSMSNQQEALETSILESKEIPFPDIPQATHGKISCSTCAIILPGTLSVLEWRLHLLEDYNPYTCLERKCPHDVRCFSRVKDLSDHQKSPHSQKSQWSCKLCGSRKFAARLQLQYHAEAVHYIPAEAAVGLCELWQEQVASQEEETECMFCNEAYSSEPDARLTHLGRHMVEIALLTPARTEQHMTVNLKDLKYPTDEEEDIEVARSDTSEEQQDVTNSLSRKEVLARLKELQLEEESSEDEQRERRYRRKKERWSAGIFKRSHSQSVEGDSSYSDNDPLDDVVSTARRLRRRVRGPGASGRRGSLVFEDHGISNTKNILEEDEPDEGIDTAETREPDKESATKSGRQGAKDEQGPTLAVAWTCGGCGSIGIWQTVCPICSHIRKAGDGSMYE